MPRRAPRPSLPFLLIFLWGGAPGPALAERPVLPEAFCAPVTAQVFPVCCVARNRGDILPRRYEAQCPGFTADQIATILRRHGRDVFYDTEVGGEGEISGPLVARIEETGRRVLIVPKPSAGAPDLADVVAGSVPGEAPEDETIVGEGWECDRGLLSAASCAGTGEAEGVDMAGGADAPGASDGSAGTVGDPGDGGAMDGGIEDTDGARDGAGTPADGGSEPDGEAPDGPGNPGNDRPVGGAGEQPGPGGFGDGTRGRSDVTRP